MIKEDSADIFQRIIEINNRATALCLNDSHVNAEHGQLKKNRTKWITKSNKEYRSGKNHHVECSPCVGGRLDVPGGAVVTEVGAATVVAAAEAAASAKNILNTLDNQNEQSG